MSVRCHCLAVMAVVFSAGVASAQHDPQRNATQDLAAGNFEKAARKLDDADPQDPETLFVRMTLALAQKNTDEALEWAEKALAAGLPFDRLLAGSRELLRPLNDTPTFQKWLRERSPSPLLHGPMLGCVTESGASFWVRTANPATVQVRVLSADGKATAATSEPVATSLETELTGVLPVSGLEPRTTYRYEVLVDGKPAPVENASFQTFPRRGEAAAFAVGFGGGAGYVPKWEYMWDTILKVRPQAFLMLGDNVYIDDPTQPITQDYCYYRRQSRPEWKRLTAATAMYSIYDDHDFGTNDCVPGREIDAPPWKRAVWRKFRNNWVNPGYGGGETQPGCWYDFHIGDVHFIMLDGRYYRDRGEAPSMLGPVQKAWLLETLRKSTGTFKVLASPVPWSEGVKPGSKDPWDGFPEEREEIFSFLEDNRINGVILISADRHRTDLRKTVRKNGYDLYELESSKLTNRHTHGVVESRGFIWGYNKKCSMALMRFDTTRPDPQVTMELITIDGEKLYDFQLTLSQLTHPQ